MRGRNLTAAVIAAIMLPAPAWQPVAAEPTSSAPIGMAATVTKTKRTCFSDTLLVMGTLVPKSEVLVRPDREGLQIAQILVEPGAVVSSGHVLARLSPPDGQQSIPVPAPVAGIVSAAPTVVGVMASARGEPLFRIIAEGAMELSAEISAKQFSKLSPGQAAKVKIAGVEESPGRVRLVSATVDPTSQLGQVRIQLDHNPGLRVGAFGRAIIDVGESCGVAIPLSAVLHGPDGAVVQVIRNDRIETRRVSLGLFSGGTAEVREGLTEGDIVVVRAGAFLREGDRVRPVLAGESGGQKQK